jgi:L-aminopeptidase/D-esterase-like protein
LVRASRAYPSSKRHHEPAQIGNDRDGGKRRSTLAPSTSQKGLSQVCQMRLQRATKMIDRDSIADVPGILVGHDTDLEARTGLTVVLCPDGAVGGVDVRGAAPGTRETDLLRPGNFVKEAHAVLLTGGSAFGLAAAEGVVRYLAERGYGLETGSARVPIVPAAVLYDLALARAPRRPTAMAGYRACLTASTSVAEGSVGAGTGATFGKRRGRDRAVKGGIGSASATLSDGVIVGAIVAVNAYGDVCDPASGRLFDFSEGEELPSVEGFPGTNTTIGVIATSARLTKEGANRVAQMGHDGLARAIRPAHTMFDGDTLFALATGTHSAQATPLLVSEIGNLAAEVVSRAIVRAVLRAYSLGDVPSVSDLRSRGERR